MSENERPDWNKEYPIASLVTYKGHKKIGEKRLFIDDYEKVGLLTKKPIPWFVREFWNK